MGWTKRNWTSTFPPGRRSIVTSGKSRLYKHRVSSTTMILGASSSTSSGLNEKPQEQNPSDSNGDPTPQISPSAATEMQTQDHEEGFQARQGVKSKMPYKARLKSLFAPGGKLQPFRLLRQDITNTRKRYVSDWSYFNQLILASAVYVFFTNLLPGITFASDLYVLTGKAWGTIEVVFSTGLCGIIFSV